MKEMIIPHRHQLTIRPTAGYRFKKGKEILLESTHVFLNLSFSSPLARGIAIQNPQTYVSFK